MPITQTMRRALKWLYQNKDPFDATKKRPSGVTVRTMLALRKRGLIERKDDKWVITEAGKDAV